MQALLLTSSETQNQVRANLTRVKSGQISLARGAMPGLPGVCHKRGLGTACASCLRARCVPACLCSARPIAQCLPGVMGTSRKSNDQASSSDLVPAHGLCNSDTALLTRQPADRAYATPFVGCTPQGATGWVCWGLNCMCQPCCSRFPVSLKATPE